VLFGSGHGKGVDPKIDAFPYCLRIAGLIEAYANLFSQVAAVDIRLVPVKPAETTAPDTGAR
jgi:hypothetical protein